MRASDALGHRTLRRSPLILLIAAMAATIAIFLVTAAVAQATHTFQSKVVASDSSAGDLFGYAVAVDGDTAIIGAITDDIVVPPVSNTNQGSAYVFVRSGSTWIQQA
jgi:hypothetical protein